MIFQSTDMASHALPDHISSDNYVNASLGRCKRPGGAAGGGRQSGGGRDDTSGLQSNVVLV